MREIFFRAWTDKKTKIDPFCWLDKNNNHFKADDLSHFAGEKIVSVEQFTGLLDCKGNKIFEGDICRLDWSETMCPLPSNFVGKVEYLEGCFYISDEFYSEKLFQELMVGEIIGNIHDNPEFLKEVSE